MSRVDGFLPLVVQSSKLKVLIALALNQISSVAKACPNTFVTFWNIYNLKPTGATPNCGIGYSHENRTSVGFGARALTTFALR